MRFSAERSHTMSIFEYVGLCALAVVGLFLLFAIFQLLDKRLGDREYLDQVAALHGITPKKTEPDRELRGRIRNSMEVRHGTIGHLEFLVDSCDGVVDSSIVETTKECAAHIFVKFLDSMSIAEKSAEASRLRETLRYEGVAGVSYDVCILSGELPKKRVILDEFPRTLEAWRREFPGVSVPTNVWFVNSGVPYE